MWVSERVMMGVLEKSPRNRSSCHSQQFLEARASRTKGLNGRVHANTSAHGVEPMDKFVPVEHPSEPLEADKPTWCPRPEPCIMHVSNTSFLSSFLPTFLPVFLKLH
jgi:hypothetical protein